MEYSPTRSNEQSFYSINNTKTQFTFIQQPHPQQIARPPSQEQIQSINVQNILQKFDIRQSSALQLQSEDLLNQSFRSVASKESKTMNLHDISAIDQPQSNELECSMCLQHQIDCLSIPKEVTSEEMKALQQKMNRLKTDQSLLKKQIQTFQEAIIMNQLKNQDIAAQVIKVNKFIKKKCEHQSQNTQPFNFPPLQSPSVPSSSSVHSQITIKSGKQSPQRKQERLLPQKKKHFDIKPNRGQSTTQKQANAKYKECSFNRQAILLEDRDNQYRIQLKYQQNNLIVSLVSFQKGETNFIHALRINQQQFYQKISQKIVYPLKTHTPKKFTLSLSIMLLIFQQNKQKEQSNLIKIQQIRCISIPLPLNYFIQPRFTNLPKNSSILQQIYQRLYIYQIDINFNADYSAYKHVLQIQWLQNHWINLRGSTRVIYVELEEIKERGDSFGIVFKIGCKEKDCQEAIDVIQYMCFMLAL